VDVQLVVGDAEALPVADVAFGVVLSGFGAIFAPPT
jgi:ubiquinone/menaquinone biosynthesis C-methylase UbiE